MTTTTRTPRLVKSDLRQRMRNARKAALIEAFFEIVERKGPIDVRQMVRDLNIVKKGYNGTWTHSPRMDLLAEIRRNGCSLLMAARTPEAVYALSKAGLADREAKDGNGDTVLHHHIDDMRKIDHLQRIVALAEIGVPLDAENAAGETAFTQWAPTQTTGGVALAMTLLLLGADIEKSRQSGNALSRLAFETPAPESWQPTDLVPGMTVRAMIEAGAKPAEGLVRRCRSPEVYSALTEPAPEKKSYYRAESLLRIALNPRDYGEEKARVQTQKLVDEIARVRGILEERKAKAAADATRATAAGWRAASR